MKWHNGEDITYHWSTSNFTRVVLRESGVTVGHIQREHDAPRHWYPTSDTAKMWEFQADSHATMTGALRQIVDAAAARNRRLEEESAR